MMRLVVSGKSASSGNDFESVVAAGAFKDATGARLRPVARTETAQIRVKSDMPVIARRSTANPATVGCLGKARSRYDSKMRSTVVLLRFLGPSRLLAGDRRFRHLACFHRHLLQAIDKPSAGRTRR